MKRKVWIECMIVLLVCGSALFAKPDEFTEKWEPHGELSFTFEEQYIGLRVSKVLYDRSVLWSNLYLDLPGGFYLNGWWSVDLQDDEVSSTWADEFDSTLGYKWKINDFDASISASLYNIIPLRKWWNENVWSQDFTLSKTFSYGDHSISPEFWIGWISETNDFESGSLFMLPNVKHFWKEPFGIEKLTFSQTIMLAWDDGFNMCGNKSDGIFIRWMPGLNWEIGKNTTLVAPAITILGALTDPHDGRGGETSLNFSLIHRF